MPIPDYQSLMLPVLKTALKGEIHIAEVVNVLAQELKLAPEERSALLASGKQSVFTNRVHWAKSYLTKAGLVQITRRGYFTITERGKNFLQTGPKLIDNQSLLQFEEFRTFFSRSKPTIGDAKSIVASVETDDEQTPDELMRTAYSQIDTALAQDLLERVRSGTPEFFERMLVTLLLNMGYGGSVQGAGQALGKSGDGGVDGVIDQDALGLDRVYIQAKRYAAGNNIGSGAIRDFFGSLDRHKAAKGLFVTTSSFSPAAEETANHLSKRIVLIDGVQLTQLMIRFDVGCRLQETFHVKKLDEDFFEGPEVI